MKAAVAVGSTLGKWVAWLWLALVALGADAAQLVVLLDTDNNVATGCTVAVPGGTFPGVEWVLTTNVDATANPPLVTGVTQQNCIAPPSTLGAPMPVSPGGWAVGLGLGVNGFDIIETFFPTATPFGTYRLGFIYTDPQTGSDALLTANGAANGPPITFFVGQPPGPIPTLGHLGLLLLAAGLSACAVFVLRRHRAPMLLVVAAAAVLVGTSTWAAYGFIHDWNGASPVATDPVNDAPAGTNISAAFASTDAAAGRVYFRADVQLRMSQAITFTSTAPAAAVVRGPTYDVAAAASSGLPVGFTVDASFPSACAITGSRVSFIRAGNCVIYANQPGDANYNAAPQVRQSFAVGKGEQTITFISAPPANASVGGPMYDVSASSSSGLPVTFTIDASASTVCSIALLAIGPGRIWRVSFIGTGTCVIDANQAGDANYNAAHQAQQSFAVGKSAQTITFTSTAMLRPLQ